MQLTLEVDTSNLDELLAAQEVIATQLRLLGVPPCDEDVLAAIKAMWPEVEGARRLLYFAAIGREAEDEFTFDDIKAGVDVPSLKAWHRNLARALKARGIPIERVMPSRWDGTRQRYRLPEPVLTLVRDLPLA